LTEPPYRGSLTTLPPTNPLIYRFHELVQTCLSMERSRAAGCSSTLECGSEHTFDYVSDEQRHWVRSAGGKLLLLGNLIYLNV
jgi:hypothetical protein